MPAAGPVQEVAADAFHQRHDRDVARTLAVQRGAIRDEPRLVAERPDIDLQRQHQPWRQAIRVGHRCQGRPDLSGPGAGQDQVPRPGEGHGHRRRQQCCHGVARGHGEHVEGLERARRRRLGLQHDGQVQPVAAVGPIDGAVVDAARCRPDGALECVQLRIEGDQLERGRQERQGHGRDVARVWSAGLGPLGSRSPATGHMTLEADLYHPEPLRPQPRPLAATGRPQAARSRGHGAACGRSRGRGRDHRRRLYRPVGRLSSGARAWDPGRGARGRADRLGGVGPQWRVLRPRAGASSATATWRSAGGCRRRAGSSLPRSVGWRWCAASPPTRGSTSSPPARASTWWPTAPSRWHELENVPATVQRLFGERWPLWRKAELEERLLRSPEAHGCLVMPHYFGLQPDALRARARGGSGPRAAPWCARDAGDRVAARPAAGTGWRRLRDGHRRAGAGRHQRLHAGGTGPGAARGGCCRHCRASWSPGR